MKKIFLMLSVLQIASAQGQTLQGIVYEKNTNKKATVPFAFVYWQDQSHNSVTDAEGKFEITSTTLPAKLIASSVGYVSDTILITDATKEFDFFLNRGVELKTLQIEKRKASTEMSTMKTINSTNITQKELLKAACCNLSESFETNPTINVAYKDAVTGAKEIQLLGLSGIYAPLLTENIQNMRGVAAAYGLTFIPGPWMESIQLTKGSGSVLNGYESTTGLINIEYKKPLGEKTEKLFLNLYAEDNLRSEINSYFTKRFSDKAATMLFVHGNYMNADVDGNKDGFYDMPHSKQINAMNRWMFEPAKNMEMQVGVQYLYDEKEGGQIHPGSSDDVDHSKYYLMDVLNKRLEIYTKAGFVFPEKPGKSIGNIAQFTFHDFNSSFGKKTYNALQYTGYYQFIYQNIIGNSNHLYKAGATIYTDHLNDTYNALTNEREQLVPGIYFEYSWQASPKLMLIAGVRDDYHNKYQNVFTPRFHGKYNFSDEAVIRMSIGTSFRVPYTIADNISVLTTSRKLVFDENIQPEKALNYGLNFTGHFHLAGRDGTYSIDAYRTEFQQQMIVDWYSDSTSIHFYNLDGKSYSNSLQGSIDYELFSNFDVRIAHRWDDVRTTYRGSLRKKPLVATTRSLLNLAYNMLNDHLKFDVTLVMEGRKNLSNTSYDIELGQLPSLSPTFTTLNFQATREFRKWSIYGGAMNITDFKQKNPIIAANDPFSSRFDASNIWGPIEGRRIYVGLRFAIK